jgi:hypothetical protein
MVLVLKAKSLAKRPMVTFSGLAALDAQDGNTVNASINIAIDAKLTR